MTEPNKTDNNQSGDVDDQVLADSANVDNESFESSFAEEEEVLEDVDAGGGSVAAEDESSAVEKKPAAEADIEKKPGEEEETASSVEKKPGEEVAPENKGEASKALEAKLTERETADNAQKQNKLFEHLDTHFDGNVDEVLKSPAFDVWLKKQPQAVQDAADQADDPAAALKVLTDYQSVQQQSSAVDTDVMTFLEKHGLENLEVDVGDETDGPMSLSGFADEYPAIAKSMMAMADKIASTKIDHALSEKGYMTAEQVLSMIDGIRKVESLHSDVRDIVESDGYKSWVETQAPGVMAMAESTDANDQIFVINAYKEQEAGQETPEKKKAREKAAAAHKNKKTVHSASVEDGSGAAGGSGGESGGKDDFATSFAENDDEEL